MASVGAVTAMPAQKSSTGCKCLRTILVAKCKAYSVEQHFQSSVEGRKLSCFARFKTQSNRPTHDIRMDPKSFLFGIFLFAQIALCYSCGRRVIVTCGET